MLLEEQFLQTVSRFPNNVAIASGDKNMTYEELKDLVFRYKNSILKEIPDTRVGLVADQSVDSVVSLMATIFSGRTIVPIDPRLSIEDITAMLSPLTGSVLVDNKHYVNMSVGDLTFYKISDLDKKSTTPLKGKQVISNHPNGAAYILHTSGTTGRPKPVLASARSLEQVSNELAEAYYIDKGSKVIQFAYLSFDSAFVEIWSTLLKGATLIISGHEMRDDLYGSLSDIAKKHSNLTITLPPSVAENLSDSILGSITTLILAGEELSGVLANALFRKVKHLINAYGPTESIICATTYEIKSRVVGRVPIGQPLKGMKIVLDPQSNEMLLHSSYLAEGYIGHDGKDAFHNEEGASYYRSGDIATQDDHGNYIFLGRADRQIKLNSQRIELEGLESKLRSGTNNSMIYLVNVKTSDKTTRLHCAYKNHEPYDMAFLNSILPKNIQLTLSSRIDTIPLNGNGKVDYKKLAALLGSNGGQTDLKEKDARLKTMIRLWHSVFEEDTTITGQTAFFDIGGDSLTALKLVNLINNRHSAELKLIDIIENDTPEMLVKLLGQKQ